MNAANRSKYLTVFAALAVFTVIEVAVAFTAIAKSTQVVLLVAMALIKASLVAFYYMHLRSEGPILKVIAAFPMLLVIVLLLLPVFDLALAQ
ncbi:MAG: cytochrome C oxidase subunit IV family protein [Anaerolineales bacterium]